MRVLAFSYVPVQGTVECQIEDTTIDLSRYYKIVASENSSGYSIVLDEELDAKIKEEERTKEADQALDEMKSSLTTATLLEIATDEQALKMVALYDEWKPNTEYEKGKRIRYKDKLFRSEQNHTSETGHEPGIATASLYSEVSEKAGNDTDPIEYSGNMELEENKFYIQDGIVYRCFRNTGIPVYNPLKDLVGIYVEKVEE